ncbi:hypothetical protein XENOCAPTIV_028381 [Xenoophorus captivus]|uniref:Uncharacterized protein n=1 Tax=Xenoophorus captivus TaxID=1517983 RepID=A0ABV0RW99_9TELE
MVPLGRTSLTSTYKGQKHKIDFEIIQKDAPFILGRETCTELKMVKRLQRRKQDCSSETIPTSVYRTGMLAWGTHHKFKPKDKTCDSHTEEDTSCYQGQSLGAATQNGES